MLKIITPQQDHINTIIQNLRPADHDEITASTKQPVEQQIHKALNRSGPCFVATYKSEPMALFGIADLNGFSKIGSPWLVGTQDIEEHPIPFLRHSKPCFLKIAAEYDYLVNMVDARNAASIRWITWLGFTIHPASPYGPQRLPFHKFDLTLPPHQEI